MDGSPTLVTGDMGKVGAAFSIPYFVHRPPLKCTESSQSHNLHNHKLCAVILYIPGKRLYPYETVGKDREYSCEAEP